MSQDTTRRTNVKKLSEREITRRAFDEAISILINATDRDKDLVPDYDVTVSIQDAWCIREYIRNQIVDLLEERGSR